MSFSAVVSPLSAAYMACQQTDSTLVFNLANWKAIRKINVQPDNKLNFCAPMLSMCINPRVDTAYLTGGWTDANYFGPANQKLQIRAELCDETYSTCSSSAVWNSGPIIPDLDGQSSACVFTFDHNFVLQATIYPWLFITYHCGDLACADHYVNGNGGATNRVKIDLRGGPCINYSGAASAGQWIHNSLNTASTSYEYLGIVHFDLDSFFKIHMNQLVESPDDSNCAWVRLTKIISKNTSTTRVRYDVNTPSFRFQELFEWLSGRDGTDDVTLKLNPSTARAGLSYGEFEKLELTFSVQSVFFYSISKQPKFQKEYQFIVETVYKDDCEQCQDTQCEIEISSLSAIFYLNGKQIQGSTEGDFILPVPFTALTSNVYQFDYSKLSLVKYCADCKLLSKNQKLKLTMKKEQLQEENLPEKILYDSEMPTKGLFKFWHFPIEKDLVPFHFSFDIFDTIISSWRNLQFIFQLNVMYDIEDDSMSSWVASPTLKFHFYVFKIFLDAPGYPTLLEENKSITLVPSASYFDALFSLKFMSNMETSTKFFVYKKKDLKYSMTCTATDISKQKCCTDLFTLQSSTANVMIRGNDLYECDDQYRLEVKAFHANFPDYTVSHVVNVSAKYDCQELLKAGKYSSLPTQPRAAPISRLNADNTLISYSSLKFSVEDPVADYTHERWTLPQNYHTFSCVLQYDFQCPPGEPQCAYFDKVFQKGMVSPAYRSQRPENTFLRVTPSSSDATKFNGTKLVQKAFLFPTDKIPDIHPKTPEANTPQWQGNSNYIKEWSWYTEIQVDQPQIKVANRPPLIANLVEEFTVIPGESTELIIGSVNDEMPADVKVELNKVVCGLNTTSTDWLELDKEDEIKLVVQVPLNIKQDFCKVILVLSDGHKEPLTMAYDITINVVPQTFKGEIILPKVLERTDESPTLKTSKITMVGDLELLFDKYILLPPLFSNLTSENEGSLYFKTELIVHEENLRHNNIQLLKSNKRNLAEDDTYGFSWKIAQSKSLKDIQLEFKFNHPDLISKYAQDRLNITLLEQDSITALNPDIGVIFQPKILLLPRQIGDKHEIESSLKVGQATKIGLLTFLAGCLVLTIFLSGNPTLTVLLSFVIKYVWGLINGLQLIGLTCLFSIRLPINVLVVNVEILKISAFDFFQTERLYSVFKFSETESFNSIFDEVEMRGANFIQGTGPLCLFMVLFALEQLARVVLRRYCSNHLSKYKRIHDWLHQEQNLEAIVFRFLLESCLEIMFWAPIALINVHKTRTFGPKFQDGFSNLTGCVLLLLLLLTTAYMYYRAFSFHKLKSRPPSQNGEQTRVYTMEERKSITKETKKMKELFERQKLNFSSLICYPVFVIRRMILVLIILFLPKMQNFQIAIHILLSISMLIFMLHVRPYDQANFNRQEIFSELLILLTGYFMILFSDLIPDDSTNVIGQHFKKVVGRVMISFMLLYILINFVLVGVTIAQKALMMCKVRMAKSRRLKEIEQENKAYAARREVFARRQKKQQEEREREIARAQMQAQVNQKSDSANSSDENEEEKGNKKATHPEAATPATRAPKDLPRLAKESLLVPKSNQTARKASLIEARQRPQPATYTIKKVKFDDKQEEPEAALNAFVIGERPRHKRAFYQEAIAQPAPTPEQKNQTEEMLNMIGQLMFDHDAVKTDHTRNATDQTFVAFDSRNAQPNQVGQTTFGKENIFFSAEQNDPTFGRLKQIEGMSEQQLRIKWQREHPEMVKAIRFTMPYKFAFAETTLGQWNAEVLAKGSFDDFAIRMTLGDQYANMVADLRHQEERQRERKYF